MEMEAEINMGPCCACGCAPTPRNLVRTILMIERTVPETGPGWGCYVCGLPNEGAVAVICDRCASTLQKILDFDWRKSLTHFCTGEDSRERAPIELLDGQPVHKHDDAKHCNDRRQHAALNN